MQMEEENSYVGKQIGNYRIVAELGSGGFADVYQGQHLIFVGEPPVAIKLLYARLKTKEREHFIQEAQLLRKLHHPHMLSVLDAGFHESIPYIVMEYAAQGSLQDRLDLQPGKPLSFAEVLTILSQVGEALHYAHQQHIVHRDLKPDNILFNARGEALLADFGLATLLSSVHTVQIGSAGTPAYMAPEMFEGIVSVKSDQYALGCIAYELITGHKPLEVEGVPLYAVQYQHAHVEPMAPSQHNRQIPPHIERTILTAMAKDRNHRHADIRVFLTALQAPQTSAQEWLEEGAALYGLKRFKEALTACEQALHLDPNFAVAYHGKGAILFDLQRYEEALAAFEQALRLDPNNAFAYLSKGTILYGLQRYEEALVAFEKALRLDPNDAVAYHGKGNALYGLKRYKEALAAYEQVLRLDPNFASVYYYKGRALNDLERYKEALTTFEKALRLDPNFASAYDGKGNALNALKRYEEALTAYEQALRLDPNDAEASVGKDYALEKLGRIGEAQQAPQKTAQEWLKEGNALHKLQRYEEALAAFEQALRLDPKIAFAYDNKGFALYGLQRYEEALAAFEQALRLAPNFADANIGKDMVLDKLGRTGEAQQAPQKTAQKWLKEGYALRDLKRYEEALAAFEQALRLDPNDTYAYNCKGSTLGNLKRYEEALAAFEQVLRLDPNNAFAYNGKGLALNKLGRIGEAQQAYNKAKQLGVKPKNDL